MKSYEVLTLQDSAKWEDFVRSCKTPDIHFLPQYMKFFEERLDGKAMMFVSYNGNENFVLYPFYKRRINDIELFASLEKEYFDIISPWYFGGPLLKNEKKEIETIKNFLKTFEIFVEENFIITEFSRIHPNFNITKDFVNITKGVYQYDVSYVDLTKSEEQIWNEFKSTNQRAIRAAKKNNLEISFSLSKNSIKEFCELYTKTMENIGAEEFYFFSQKFLVELSNTFKNNMIIVTAKFEGKPIGSAVFLYDFGIFHYWLGGSDFKLRNLRPNNLLFYESIKWAKENGNRIFMFGGGSNPTLRKFKESFTSTRKKFYTIQNVFNDKVYSELNKIKLSKNKKIINKNFFPIYRA